MSTQKKRNYIKRKEAYAIHMSFKQLSFIREGQRKVNISIDRKQMLFNFHSLSDNQPLRSEGTQKLQNGACFGVLAPNSSKCS